ncbi:MAG: T9SS type A sorting domain-containing protein, partial [Bacteroidota bacterium]|nr:T9SS type A sorting domain-containing protein [Bacteroidota bacterium]
DGFMYPYSTDETPGPEGLDLQIFPNPVVSEFNMALYVDRDSELQIEFVNTLGQMMYRDVLGLNPGSQTLYFGGDVVNQAMPRSGIYFINLYLDGKFAGVKKIVKQ